MISVKQPPQVRLMAASQSECMGGVANLLCIVLMTNSFKDSFTKLSYTDDLKAISEFASLSF